ncbi:response regulator transcription factor [Caulobacter sp. UNC279MFTsu5.1]|uniref:response regulator transcription factor n=1 Tax=Caulobacter sp. UNC279MFTsu5.1 TaxID=1502775 RepID=UPI0008E3A8FA|nr:response regulator [Caulobacter sp. UNC279MFTsu5.1]SFK30434.1 Response regulator receiver domain-containing protein [Caulobacter sp. UNC279MFTsu5.1]
MPFAPPLIFVADDDAATLELIQIALEREGFAVRAFGSVEGVLAALARETPVLALLDVRMPGQSGLDGLRAIKDSPNGAALPVLMLTGDGRLDRIVQAMQLGAAGYGMKPFEPRQLAAKVRETLAGM